MIGTASVGFASAGLLPSCSQGNRRSKEGHTHIQQWGLRPQALPAPSATWQVGAPAPKSWRWGCESKKVVEIIRYWMEGKGGGAPAFLKWVWGQEGQERKWGRTLWRRGTHAGVTRQRAAGSWDLPWPDTARWLHGGQIRTGWQQSWHISDGHRMCVRSANETPTTA